MELNMTSQPYHIVNIDPGLISDVDKVAGVFKNDEISSPNTLFGSTLWKKRLWLYSWNGKYQER